MKEFKDKKTGLTWLIPKVTHSRMGTPEFSIEDGKIIKEFTQELNQYNSKAIEKYVTGGSVQLGSFMFFAAFGYRDLCYCFEDGKLVATAIITPNTDINNKDKIEAYIKYCKENTMFLEGLTGYIPVKKVQRAISKATDTSNIDINYLVVVPTHQSRGIGTRAVSSIINNPQFFAPKSKVGTLLTQIHTRNAASQKVFIRNGFEKCTFGEYESVLSLDDYINVL